MMVAIIIICILTCLVMILSVLFFPKIKLGKFYIDTYWVVTLVGAIVLVCFGLVDVKKIGEALTQNTSINQIGRAHV